MYLIKYCFKKIKSFKGAILLIIAILTAPIIVNWIMFQGKWKVAGGTSDWIGFYGAYIGSVFGGLITLLGVKLTIDAQERVRIRNSYPKKIRLIHGMIKKLNIINNHIIIQKKGENYFINEEYLKNQVEELLDEASEVDNLVFSNILSVETRLLEIFLPNYKSCQINEDGIILFVDNAEFLKTRIDAMEEIDNIISFLNKYNSKIRKKYNDISI